MKLDYWLGRASEAVNDWAAEFGPYTPHPVHHIDDDTFRLAFDDFARRLRDNYPFFHPRYAGQMVKPPHPAAIVGYLAAMLINPNNHAREGGPATCDMERDVIGQLGAMFGLPAALGHLTSSGTIANLEALYVARETHPQQGIAFSTASHFTHARMCRVLGAVAHPVPALDDGRIDLDAAEALVRLGTVGTLVLSAGTTGTGAVDAIHEAVRLKQRYGVRLHVDAAYGGFFTLLAGDGTVDPEPWAAIAQCDSVVVDPHKHGLQPYGCGAVIFADPAVARHFLHDSPYTYFTDSDLHLGEISLECSRAGAAAAALWLTFRMLPPTPAGLGRVLSVTRQAAVRWAAMISDSEHLHLHQPPELDIVTYFADGSSWSDVDAATQRILHNGMTGDDPVYLSTLRVDAGVLGRLHPGRASDIDQVRILRSALMKPEADTHLSELHRRVERLAMTKER